MGAHCLRVCLPCAFLRSATVQDFWSQRGVQYVMLGELLICIYNVILHQVTFDADTVQAGDAAAGELGDATDTTAVTLRFICVSNLSNGITCIVLFGVLPHLQKYVYVACERACG